LIARRCLVSGRVQGVFYRASARERAQGLGLTGHARNLADGRVEVLACGPPDAVETLCQWLWEGSPASKVTAVEVVDVPAGDLAPWPTAFRAER
jgi:acylphosphatase